ncbi:MAG: hypothetical protein NVSMB26_15750 [Beijerinckiaceae bacterium]
MIRRAGSWVIPLSAVTLLMCIEPAFAQSGESEEGFFTRLFKKGESAGSAKTEPTIDCPEIRVPPGESALRVGGEGSAGVRHQFSLGDVARECAAAGKDVTIKVGVKGRVVLGPAGQPGSYSAPLKIAVREQLSEKILTSKTYTVGATIAPGATGANFIIVTDPFAIPFTNEHLADDYEVIVGFDKGGKAAPSPKRKRR